jgi:hypothetical protein
LRLLACGSQIKVALPEVAMGGRRCGLAAAVEGAVAALEPLVLLPVAEVGVVQSEDSRSINACRTKSLSAPARLYPAIREAIFWLDARTLSTSDGSINADCGGSTAAAVARTDAPA